MTAFFRDNEIYRNDVDGNVQTIYFQREDETSPVVTEMIYLESASASFYIEDKELVGMTYRNDVPFTLYPIAQVPPSQPLRLKNFKWEPWRRSSTRRYVRRGARRRSRASARASVSWSVWTAIRSACFAAASGSTARMNSNPRLWSGAIRVSADADRGGGDRA